jgi:hypothetical protein
MLETMHCGSLTLRKLLSRERAGDADERDVQRRVVQVGVRHRYYLAEAAAVVRAHEHMRSALSQHAVGAALGTVVGAAGGASNSQRHNALEGVVVGLADGAAAKPAFVYIRVGALEGAAVRFTAGPTEGAAMGSTVAFVEE